MVRGAVMDEAVDGMLSILLVVSGGAGVFGECASGWLYGAAMVWAGWQ